MNNYELKFIIYACNIFTIILAQIIILNSPELSTLSIRAYKASDFKQLERVHNKLF